MGKAARCGSRRRRSGAVGATPCDAADRRPHRAARHARGRRRRLARRAHARRRPRLSDQRRGHPPAASAARRRDRRADRGAAAPLARRRRRHAPDVARSALSTATWPSSTRRCCRCRSGEQLLERGIQLVEVPDEEFETMGTNVLALAPRRCVMLAAIRDTRGARTTPARRSSSTRAARSASRAPADRRA